MGSPVSGQGGVLQPAIVPKAIPPSGGIGSRPSRWGHPSLRQWGLPTFARHVGLAYAFPVHSFGMRPPFFGSSSRIHTSSIGSSELLAAGGCAFVLLVLLIFDSGLSSHGLICCYTMSLRYVDLLYCGCVPTVWLATGFVAIFPFLCSPACSGCAGSCGFSSPIWFATFAMGPPLRGRGW